MSFSVLKGAKERVYLDHNATTPVAEKLSGVVLDSLNSWGNPSSIHWAGRGPKALIREARRNLSQALGVEALELVFTSGGSEANNMALIGLFDYVMSHQEGELRPFRLIISGIEHPSVNETAEYLRSKGASVEKVRVDRLGQVDMDQYHQLLEEPTDLVSCMLANNETGTILPIREMAELAKKRGAFFHTDAVQSLGKCNFNLKELGVDYASFSGHKFYAPKGIGLLYCRRGAPQLPLIHGGRQERGRRAGTENLLGISALGAMADELSHSSERNKKVEELRNHMEARILAEIAQVKINAESVPRLSNTSSLLVESVDGESLLMALDIKGFAVSTGAACSSGSPEPSPVLIAMGLTRKEAQSSLRISLGWENTLEEIDQFVDCLIEVVARLRNIRQPNEERL